MKMKLLLLMCCCLVVMVLSEPCPDQTRPHASRCDQYFRCVLLPSKTHVWVPTQCKKGLIYEPQLKTCVLPGDNWECNLSAEEGEESGENVYGINNLPAAIYTGPTGRPVPSTTPVRSMDREVASTDSGYGASGVPEGSFTTEAESTNESETVTPGGLSNLPTVSGDNEGQATVYDNLREQIMNDSMYSNYQSSFMDAYGNRFPMQQQMSNTPMYPYPPPPPMAYPVFSQPQYQYPHPYPNPYYDQSLAMNRLRTSGAYDNDDSQSNENVLSEEEDDASAEVPEKDVPVAVDQQSNEEESEEISEQSGTKKLIAVGGSIMNYKDYKDSILPLLDANPDDVRISVLTCTLGSRQPNKTECTKYYVCNPQNGAFQSFTCPSFTAFNADTRLCDSATYKSCQNAKQTTTTQKATTLSRIAQPTHQTKLTSEANQLKQNLITAHKYIDMIKKQAYKILSRNKITTETPTEQPENDGMIRITAPTMASMVPSITAPTYTTSTTTKRLRAKPKRKHTKKRTSVKSGLHKAALSKASRKSTSSTTSTTSTTTTTTSTTQPPAPKAPKCRKNGKMPDPAVKNNYYVCYKASPKKFIKTRMACPHNLVYCESTGLCTYERKCKRG
ncbi:flocculation protein FLO11 isoform X2 [Aedes aegypti]|uniref:Chitin-binding type-2 domain-containing protein n=1 Tax=Aedes aegypti TaxID=7159 RepID=A0A6I8TCX3_AEDAE|nr:flocculation protein FLO11 isoform X2 [Aedes aegypti]